MRLDFPVHIQTCVYVRPPTRLIDRRAFDSDKIQKQKQFERAFRRPRTSVVPDHVVRTENSSRMRFLSVRRLRAHKTDTLLRRPCSGEGKRTTRAASSNRGAKRPAKTNRPSRRRQHVSQHVFTTSCRRHGHARLSPIVFERAGRFVSSAGRRIETGPRTVHVRRSRSVHVKSIRTPVRPDDASIAVNGSGPKSADVPRKPRVNGARIVRRRSSRGPYEAVMILDRPFVVPTASKSFYERPRSPSYSIRSTR